MRSVQANTRIWRDSTGKTVAFALVDPYSNFRFEMRPGAEMAGLESQIVDWGVECVRGAGVGIPGGLTLDACMPRG